MTTEEVRERLRAAVRSEGSLRAWSAHHGVSHSRVSEILTGRREPGGRVLELLRLQRVPPVSVFRSLDAGDSQ